MQKPNPSLFLQAMDIYLERLSVKKIIPIPYENARNEVYFDMINMFPQEHQEIFKQAIKDFENITDIEEWYND